MDEGRRNADYRMTDTQDTNSNGHAGIKGSRKRKLLYVNGVPMTTHRRRKRLATREGYLFNLLSFVRHRRGKKHEYDLDLEWFLTELERQKDRCIITDIPFQYPSFDNPHAGPFAPSLDRIDNDRGYTRDNVEIVCSIYNRAKHTYDHTDVVKLAKALVDKG